MEELKTLKHHEEVTTILNFNFIIDYVWKPSLLLGSTDDVAV